MKADKGKKRISQKPYNDATDKNGEEYRIVNGVKTLTDGQYRVFFLLNLVTTMKRIQSFLGQYQRIMYHWMIYLQIVILFLR